LKTISKFLLIAALLIASNAMADTYNLMIDHCTGGCGTNPFGKVEVTSGGTDIVNFKVTLFNGNGFVDTGFQGAFGFNVAGLTLSVGDFSGITTGFAYGNTGAGQWDGFGDLEYSITCPICGNGASNPNPGPLEFTITHTGLTTDSFKELSTGPGSDMVFFVADIYSPTGNSGRGATGPVGAVTPETPQVPEPASLMLMGSGLGLLASRLRRRK
jgi:hypothetical protein